MSDLSIQKANFDKQKNELKKFADQPATSTELGKFDTSGKLSDFLTGGFFGLKDHKVTGEELNVLVTELQSCFAEINERDRKVIKEFGQVYETFEVLDKEYIQGILISIKSAERASQEAKDAQKDIDVTIKALQRTINKLKEFKNQIDGYYHLPEVDELWVNVKQIGFAMEELKRGLTSQANTIVKNNNELSNLKTRLGKLSHLYEIDSLWEEVQKVASEVAGISKEYNKLEESISETTNELEVFQNRIRGYRHLEDIDKFWEDLQSQKKEISSSVARLEAHDSALDGNISEITGAIHGQEHFNEIDNIWESVKQMKAESEGIMIRIESLASRQTDTESRMREVSEFTDRLMSAEHIDDIDSGWEYAQNLGSDLREVDKKTMEVADTLDNYVNKMIGLSSENKLLKRRISIAYMIAGGALALSVLQLILTFMGMI